MNDRYASFTALITGIYRSMQRIKKSEMKELGLLGSQVQCLFYLYFAKEGLSAKELSEICEEDKGAVSRITKGLENKGMIYLEDSDTKIYKRHYKLTEQGRALGKHIADKTLQFVEKASAGIDDESREILYYALEVICANLKDLCE